MNSHNNELAGLRNEINELKAKIQSQQSVINVLKTTSLESLNAIWIVDTDFKIIEVNEKMQHDYFLAFGRYIELGIHGMEILPGNRKSLWLKNYKKCFEGKEVNFEFVENIGDEKHFFHTKLSPIINAGEISGVIAVARDITEFEKIKKQHQILELNYVKILEGVGGAVVICKQNADGEYIIVQSNKNALELYGLGHFDLLGKHLLDFEAKKTGGLHHVQFIPKKGVKIQSQHKNAHDEIFDVEIFIKPIEIEGVSFRITTIFDISDRKNFEERILHTSQKFQTLYDKAPLPYQSLSADGHIIDVNPTWLKLLGYKRHEVIGEWMGKFIHPSFHEGFAKKFAEFKKNGEVKGAEFILLKRNGEEIWISNDGCIGYDSEGSPKQTYCVFSDITEEKNTKLLAEKNHKKYVDLFQNLPVPIWIQDYDNLFKRFDALKEQGVQDLDSYLERNPFEVSRFAQLVQVTDFNQEIIKFYEATDFDEIRDNYQRIFTRKSLNAFKDLCLKLWRGEKRFHAESEIRTMKGNIKNITLNLHFENDDTLKHKGILAQMDITPLKLALSESNKLQLAIKQSPNIVVITDVEGNIEYVNPAFEKITSYKSEEVLGKNPRFLKSDLHDDAFYKNMWDTINRGDVWEGEFCNKSKTGKLIWEDATISPIKNSDGKITHFLGLKDDITEKKKLNLLLEENEHKFKDMFYSSPDAISIIELESGKYVDNNPAHTRLFGYQQNELLGQDSIALDIWVNSTDYQDIIKLLLQDKRVESKEVSLNKKGGKKFRGLISAALIQYNKKPHIIAFTRDISEILKAKEKAIEGDRLKTAFLANLSHEIRTPLNGILGFSQLLSNPKNDLKTNEKFVNIIQNSGTRLLNIMDDLMHISKIETHQVNVHIRAVNISELIHDLYLDFNPLASSKGLSLKYNIDSKAGITEIQSDYDMLKKVLTDLVKNAIKYTHHGFVDFGYQFLDSSIRFFCNDTGIGIEKSRQKAIFDRFVQADIEDKKAFQGAGLGLSIAKAFVELLEGNIYVQSIAGHGSRFYFDLPLNIKRHPEPKKEIVSIPKKKINILIAEDEEPSFELLRLQLQDIPCEIHHVYNGLDAVSYTRSNSDLGLILMDMKMPGMSGLEATSLIREFNKDVIIIAQTAYALAGDADRILNAGCNDYITKPINKDKLIARVIKHLG